MAQHVLALILSCITAIPLKFTNHQHMEGDWNILPQCVDASLSVFFFLFVFFLLTARNTNTNPRAARALRDNTTDDRPFCLFPFFPWALVQPAAFETRCCEFRSGRFSKIVNKKFTSTRTSAGSSSIFAPPGVTCQLIFVEITEHVEGEFRNLRS